MKQKWFILFLLLGAGLALLVGCTTRTTSTPQTGEPAGPPVQTAVPVAPTAPEAASPVPAGTAGPTEVPPTPPAALSSPQFTVQGTLEGGVQWGTTADGNYFKGDPNAPLIMFEFSDFQWPYCGKYVRETLPQLEQNYVATGKVVYIFYQLPLNSIHPNAQVAAEATECAGRQAKFWEMHNQLFVNQSEWAGSEDALTILQGYATKLGLDQVAFDACLSGNETAEKVQADSAFAASLGIGGTPFFVINQDGKLFAVNGAQPYESFQQGLDGLLPNP